MALRATQDKSEGLAASMDKQKTALELSAFSFSGINKTVSIDNF